MHATEIMITFNGGDVSVADTIRADVASTQPSFFKGSGHFSEGA